MTIDLTLNIDLAAETNSELETLYTKAAESLAWHAPEKAWLEGIQRAGHQGSAWNTKLGKGKVQIWRYSSIMENLAL